MGNTPDGQEGGSALRATVEDAPATPSAPAAPEGPSAPVAPQGPSAPAASVSSDSAGRDAENGILGAFRIELPDLPVPEDLRALREQVALRRQRKEAELLKKELGRMESGDDDRADARRHPNEKDVRFLISIAPPRLRAEKEKEPQVRAWLKTVWRVIQRCRLFEKHFPEDVLDFAADAIDGDAAEDWESRRTSHTLPTTWEGFEHWLLDIVETPKQRRNRAADRLGAAKIRTNQSCRDFFRYLADILKGFPVPLPEEIEIEVTNSKMLPYIRSAYSRIPEIAETKHDYQQFCIRVEDSEGKQARDNPEPLEPGAARAKRASRPAEPGNAAGQKRKPAPFVAQRPPKRSGNLPTLSDRDLQYRRSKDLCLQCGKPGHMARGCTNPPAQGSDGPSVSAPTSRVRALRQHGQTDPTVGNPDAPAAERALEAGVSMEVEGKVAETNALIDSAADRNMIDRGFINRYVREPFYAPVGRVEMANGSYAPLYGTLSADITMTDAQQTTRTLMQPFMVMDLEGYDVLLGWDWLIGTNPKIDWRAKRWSYRRKTIPRIELQEPHAFVRSVKALNERPMVLKPNTGGVTGILPEELAEFKDVFADDRYGDLVDQRKAHHALDLQEGKEPPYLPIYNMSERELKTLREYIDSATSKGWIRPSTSPAGAPVLFAPKADGSLRLCVDYRGLNAITVRNRYPLPLIDEMLDRLAGAKVYSKLDVRDAYHRIPIREGDEWKSAFRTRYGHFEYRVMPFGMTNAPATFQNYIHTALKGLVDITCIVYLDDILVFSRSKGEHTEALKEILERLYKYKLYLKLPKCEFYRDNVEFLGYTVGKDGVGMQRERVETVLDWPTPQSVRDVQVFIGFTNFYRRFIYRYSVLTAPITDLLKGIDTTKRGRGKKNGRPKGPASASKAAPRRLPRDFRWTAEADAAFQRVKEAFLNDSLLRHFDPHRETRLETDASNFAAGAVLTQAYEEAGAKQWHPIAFYSFKFEDAERNYTTSEQELLAIVRSFQHWRHYLDGTKYPVQVITDHANLQTYQRATHVLRNG